MVWFLDWIYGYFCTYAPRLDISLKKIPGPSNFHATYLSQYSRRCYSTKKDFPIWSLFFRIYKLHLYFFLKKVVLRSLSLPVGIFFFLRIRSPRIPQQVGRVQIWRLCDFFKRNIQPRGIFMHLYFFQKSLYFEVCKFEKKILPAGIFCFFCKYHRLEYRDK